MSLNNLPQGPFRPRLGFNLVELLIALAITAALLAATTVALDASFMAYQSTTELASTHTIARLAMLRMQTLIRTGQAFGPYPLDPNISLVESDTFQIQPPQGPLLELRYKPAESALYIARDPGTPGEQENLLMGGVMPQYDDDGNYVYPFTLEYELGRKLHRATVDLLIIPDDNASVTLDGDNQQQIRLVTTSMPRITAYADD